MQISMSSSTIPSPPGTKVPFIAIADEPGRLYTLKKLKAVKDQSLQTLLDHYETVSELQIKMVILWEEDRQE